MIQKFIDNTESGKCQRCGKSPETQENPFLMLKLKNIPRTNILILIDFQSLNVRYCIFHQIIGWLFIDLNVHGFCLFYPC